ncbi:MAG: hypothetical protein GOV02_03005 [Candidatus Aenigmarchaeota archaeon]|nr:hypothetical protein [Candidatus Aenigmarchaeota archaeon]
MSMKEGSWWLESKLDPRWNCHGKGIVGGFALPKAAESKIETMKMQYGKQPDDLEYEYLKD